MSTLDSLIGNSTINAFCVALVFFTIIYNFKYLYAKKNKGTGLVMLWFVITIYSVFYSPIQGDNYTSLEPYYSYINGVNESYLHFEPIYFRIMDYVPYGYVIWRFAIWGTGALLLTLYVKWMHFDVHVTTIALLFFSLDLLNYQRAIVGYVLLYIGMTMLVKSLEVYSSLVVKITHLILAIICLIAVLPFHNTMPFYILVMIAAVFLPKRRVVLLICAFVIAFLSTGQLADYFLNNTFEETKAVADYYLENAKVGQAANLFGMISQIIIYGPFYIMLAYCSWNINSGVMAFNQYEKVTLTNTLLLVLASLAFSNVSISIRGKFYTASLLPWGLFLASYYTRNRGNIIAKSYVKVSLYAFIAGMAISILSGSFIDKF